MFPIMYGVLVCGMFLLFIQFSMLLFVILIQNIYRGHRFGAAGVGTAPPNRVSSASVPDTEVSAPLPATI
jgi:hypothetical protein